MVLPKSLLTVFKPLACSFQCPMSVYWGKKKKREREKLTLHLVDLAVGDPKFVNIMSFFLILV